jgi:parallel beta-helix repeat protein
VAFDSNPGTETQPWKTISKATPLLRAGDTLSIKAGIYRETVILSESGTVTKPITIMAYPGEEGKVVINAAEPLTTWQRCTGPNDCSGNPHWSHIYYADAAPFVTAHPDKTFAIRQVFQHGRLLPRSRYPNTGWRYPTAIVNPKTAFSDRTLAKPRGYFDGAVCHIKTAMWRIDQVPIASFTGSTIALARKPNPWDDISTRFGYYVTSIVGEINEEGEWAYDPTLKRLYLWPRGDSPTDVEFTYREYCIRTYDNVSFNVVRGLTMRNPYQHGIWLYLANSMTIESNTIEYAFTHGIELQSTYGPCNDNQILRNTIKYSGYRAINVDIGAARCNVEGNHVYATGVEHFGGDLMHGPSEGVYIGGPFARVYHNRIDRVGNVGLYLHGEARGRDVSYNYITNTGLALSDTGGIYAAGFRDGPEKDHIHHNIIVDSFGCQTMDKQCDPGTPLTIETYAGDAHGIYVDEEGNNRIIEYNTVIGSRSAGIYFHWAPSNVVQKNTLYGNKVAQVHFEGKNEPRKTLADDALLDNILFATDKQQRTLYLAMNYDDVHFGRSDRNCFYNPFDDRHVYVSRYPSRGGTSRKALTLKGWRALSGYDDNSTEFSYLDRFADATIQHPVKSRIVYNASLEVASVDLGADKYCDVQGNKVYGKVSLLPFESKILIAADYDIPAPALP